MSTSAGHGGQLLVLGKISSILDSFDLERRELTLGELRQSTGLPSSTLQRLVANLVEHGFLDRTGRGVRIGGRLTFWAAAGMGSPDLLEVVRPALGELRDLTGETACFYQVSADLRICTAVAETRHEVRQPMRVGQAMPIHAGSAGLVVMGFDPELAERVLRRELPRLTEQTVTDVDTLRRRVEQARIDGFAVTTGEREDGASGLSAPVFDVNREVVGAITVMGPTFRMVGAEQSGWLDALLEVAHRVTRACGGSAPQGVERAR